MALSDRTLICVECGGEFIFTAGEQEFFAARGFSNEPKRCRSCRAVRRSDSEAAVVVGVAECTKTSHARCIR